MGHYIESIVTAVAIAAAVIVTVIVGGTLLDNVAERHNDAVHAEKIACIAKASDDLALIACRDGVGGN